MTRPTNQQPPPRAPRPLLSDRQSRHGAACTAERAGPGSGGRRGDVLAARDSASVTTSLCSRDCEAEARAGASVSKCARRSPRGPSAAGPRAGGHPCGATARASTSERAGPGSGGRRGDVLAARESPSATISLCSRDCEDEARAGASVSKCARRSPRWSSGPGPRAAVQYALRATCSTRFERRAVRASSGRAVRASSGRRPAERADYVAAAPSTCSMCSEAIRSSRRRSGASAAESDAAASGAPWLRSAGCAHA